MLDQSTEFDVRCTEHGSFFPKYSDEMKPCRPVVCGSARMYGNALLVKNVTASIVYPQQVQYSCNVGYSMGERAQNEFNNTLSLSSCVASGSFSQLNSLCVPVICGAPPAFENAIGNIDPKLSLTFSEAVEYRCDHGHTTDGDSKSNTSFKALWGAEGELFPAP